MEFAKCFFLSKTDLIDANNNLPENIVDGIWDKLNLTAMIILIAMAVISIVAVISYYTWYNERPGRHYTPQKWCMIFAIEVLLVLIVSAGVAYGFYPSGDFKKLLNYEIQMVLLNTLYSLIPYFVLSWFWCQFGWPTNAYRYIKF